MGDRWSLGQRTNGGVLCDVDDGPCACGAWHHPGEFDEYRRVEAGDVVALFEKGWWVYNPRELAERGAEAARKLVAECVAPGEDTERALVVAFFGGYFAGQCALSPDRVLCERHARLAAEAVSWVADAAAAGRS